MRKQLLKILDYMILLGTVLVPITLLGFGIYDIHTYIYSGSKDVLSRGEQTILLGILSFGLLSWLHKGNKKG